MNKRRHFPMCLVLALTLALAGSLPCSASTTASAKQAKKGRAKARKPKIKIKHKKTKTQAEKTPQKTPAEKLVGPKIEPPKPIVEVGSARWTDPIELRDTLFLSAVARQLRSP